MTSTVQRRALPLAFASLVACVHPSRATVAARPREPVHLHGVVTYEARHPTPRGASLALEVRPARWVEVEARGVNGAMLARTITSADGGFDLDVLDTPREVVAISHAHWNGHDVAVSPDRAGMRFHEVHLPVEATSLALTLRATDAAPGGPAGAFHITDTMLRGVEATRVWTGQTLPPLWAWWGRGITTQWSYYHGERPAHSGRYAIELLGGRAGEQGTSDTDEHDEAIVLHEVGHFVFDRLSTSSSIGGMHPSGSLVDPGLAWEEGRATWFATVVLGSPTYQDSVGVEPTGTLRVDRDIEGLPDALAGNGAETSVSQVLWDLADGTDGIPDTNHDGVALGPAEVLRAMISQRDIPGAYPCLGDFVRSIMAHGAVSELALARMLDTEGEPRSIVTGGGPPWLVDLGTLPAEVYGKVDGRTNPAPSGGRARPENGLDAERVYRIHLATRSRVLVTLHIAGSGSTSDHTDLAVELRTQRADLLTAARSSGPITSLSRVVAPGYYVLYVRDAGNDGGNRADFTLNVRATAVP